VPWASFCTGGQLWVHRFTPEWMHELWSDLQACCSLQKKPPKNLQDFTLTDIVLLGIYFAPLCMFFLSFKRIRYLIFMPRIRAALKLDCCSSLVSHSRIRTSAKWQHINAFVKVLVYNYMSMCLSESGLLWNLKEQLAKLLSFIQNNRKHITPGKMPESVYIEAECKYRGCVCGKVFLYFLLFFK